MRHAPDPSVRRRVERFPAARCVTTEAWPVACEDFSADPAFRIRAHEHSTPHVCFVLSGSLTERDGFHRRPMPAGSARVSPAGDRHELSIDDGRGIRCLVLSIAPDRLDDPAPPGARAYVEGPGVAALVGRLRDELRVADDASPISLEMLALEATCLARADASPRVGAPPRWLERVRDRVRDDPGSIPTLRELATDAGVSRATLARSFRGRFGCTIGEYARSHRVDTARRLLLRTDMPLASVAFAAGFADQSHMTRQVGSRLGVTPGRLRAGRGAA